MSDGIDFNIKNVAAFTAASQLIEIENRAFRAMGNTSFGRSISSLTISNGMDASAPNAPKP